ncbi:MAG: amidohydrolase, partial [Gemmatimonadetes bacterium]|nr:amidohydrolase [Gemmatimonadota bacterium]
MTAADGFTVDDLKRRVCEAIDGRGEEIIGVAATIMANPEPGFREVKTARLVADVMTRLGLAPRTGI